MLKIPQPIYCFPYMRGFGDCWAEVNFLLKTSERTKKTQLVNENSWNPMFDKIANSLISTGNFKQTSHSGNYYISHIHAWQSPYCKTLQSWTPNKSKIACYQLDGRWRADAKNLNDHETKMLFNFLHTLGYKSINVGGMRPLKEIISDMCKAEFFIGVPSGMSHIGCSIGIPEFIICKPELKPDLHLKEVYFEKENVTLVTSVESLIIFLKQPRVNNYKEVR